MSGSSSWYDLVVRVALRKLFDLGRADLFGTFPDELPPPPGFSSWVAYQRTKELSSDMDFLPLGDPAPEGSKVAMVFTRIGEDVATCGLHYVHANPGLDGDTLAFTDGERAAIEARLSTMWNSIRGLYAASIELDRYEWHDFGVGIRRPNPKVRETLGLASPGTEDSAVALPPQVAVSVTLKTDHRKTWGRIFLPAPILATCVAGRIDPDAVATIRTAVGVMLDGVSDDNTPLVVWSPRREGHLLVFGEAAHASNLDLPDTTSFAKGVNQVQVDDLFDVIESRRFDSATVRDTHTLGA